MNRFDKLEHLLETCSEEFISSCIMLREMVGWMSENDFNEFYDKLCSNWDIR